jgi:myo-inositol 2-dehydrogenase/D-chiro-inositol 1-dehydrogenase
MLDGVEATSVTAIGSHIVHPALGACGDVDAASASVAPNGGQVASLQVSRTSHRGCGAPMRIVGDKGALDLGARIPRLPLTLESDGCLSAAGQVDFLERFGGAFLCEARASIKAVQSGGPTPLGLKDAREATWLACATRDALKVRAYPL